MSAAAQRRLHGLIGKFKQGALTAREQRELENLLEDVDRKSFWLLARRLIRTV